MSQIPGYSCFFFLEDIETCLCAHFGMESKAEGTVDFLTWEFVTDS